MASAKIHKADVREPTMHDVAREAGVAQSTVSRVLNNRPSRIPITPETRDRVLAAAQRVGYRPNPFARALRGASTMLLGAIVRDIRDPFFAGAIDALSIQAGAAGYNVILGNAHGEANEAIALTAVLETRHCDAIVVLGDMRDQPRLIRDLQATSVPVVGLWLGSRLQGIRSVNVDNRAGIIQALDYLFGQGHRRIAFVGGRTLGDIKERRAAFVETMAKRGEPIEDGYIQPAINTPAGGGEALRTLMKLPKPPTAIVAATDVLAIGILRAATTLGLSVPGQISVTGFDDIPWAELMIPSLTTLRMPVSEMIAQALAMATPAPGADQIAHRLLQASLVVRDSTGPASTGR